MQNGYKLWFDEPCSQRVDSIFNEPMCYVCQAQPDPGPCWNNNNGYLPVDYRGTISQTTTKRPCQKWSSQNPTEHQSTPEHYPDANLGNHNFCRNPGNDEKGSWCIVHDEAPGTQWEYCSCNSGLDGTEGEITLKNYDASYSKEWTIDSSCSRVRLRSEQFDTEANVDIVTIDGIQYSGTEEIHMITTGSWFRVSFISDAHDASNMGFVIQWSCTDGM